MQVEDNRTLIYVSQRVATDSAWPFTAGEQVRLSIEPDKKRLVVEKAPSTSSRAPALGLLLVLVLLAACLDTGPGISQTAVPVSSPVGTTRVAGTTDQVTAPETVGVISGTVTDDQLRPINATTVILAELQARLTADADGRFTFLDVPAGKHRLEAYAPGYAGTSKSVQVEAGATNDVAVTLIALAVIEPRVIVHHHTGMVNYSVGPSGYVGGPACSDSCDWYLTLAPPLPERLLVEVDGQQSVPNPRGKHMISLNIYAHPRNSSDWRMLHVCSQGAGAWANGGFDHPCSLLPMRIPIDGRNLSAEANPKLGSLERLRFDYMCDNSWMCIGNRYDFYISLFYDWEGKEIPPDYSARPGG